MAERLSDAEIAAQLARLPGWSRQGDAIARQYTFKDFVEAMQFVHRVADLAEAADHHPDILIRYRRVTLTLSTHSAGGLTEKDFRLAGQIDAG
jgi:4a-hydroxytetrahydrobiopterin dehydratase